MVPLKVGVGERVVLDPDRQPLHRRVERRLVRHRPALEHAVGLQPEVVVQPGGVVLLDDEDRLLVGLARAGAGSGVARKSRFASYSPSAAGAAAFFVAGMVASASPTIEPHEAPRPDAGPRGEGQLAYRGRGYRAVGIPVASPGSGFGTGRCFMAATATVIPLTPAPVAQPRASWVPTVAAVQGLYFLVTGVWPLVYVESFLAVTGPKTDLWLVYTVGALVGVVGAVLLAAARSGRVTPEVALLAVGSALALAAIDVTFVARKVIDPIYLADAAAEVVLVLWWAVAWTRRPADAVP